MKIESFALNRELVPVLEELAKQPGAPLWVELIPAGEKIVGRDGRTWNNSNPEAIVEAFENNGADLPIDVEHSTEIKGPNGEAAPAMAWIKALDVREGGSVWGLVEWTDDGRWMVESKQYRYISPVFTYSTKSAQVLKLKSAGLTNNPNLHLTALNRRDNEDPPKEKTTMKTLLIALGLSETATEAEALNAFTKLTADQATALNAAKVEAGNLDNMVPRADYDVAVNRAQDAEKKIAAAQTEAQDKAIESAINSALESGVITPATKDYHLASCQAEGGLDRFNEFAKAAPKVGESDGNLDDKNAVDSTVLSDEDKAVCRLLGIDEADHLKQKTTK